MKMSVREARAQFAAAVSSAERGEPVILTRNGKPVAQITSPPADEKPDESAEEFSARLERVRKKLGLDKLPPDPRTDEEWLADFNDPELTREIFGSNYVEEEPVDDKR